MAANTREHKLAGNMCVRLARCTCVQELAANTLPVHRDKPPKLRRLVQYRTWGNQASINYVHTCVHISAGSTSITLERSTCVQKLVAKMFPVDRDSCMRL